MKSNLQRILVAAFGAVFALGCQTTGDWWEKLGGEGYKTKDPTLDAPLRPKSDPRPWWDRPLEKRAQEIDEHLGR